MLRKNVFSALIVGTVLVVSTAVAQTWPSMPIKIIVGYPPGGIADAIPRLGQDRLAGVFGQPIIVENKPGGGGVIAMNAVVMGDTNHTLGIQLVQNVIYPGISRRGVTYNPRKDLRGISMIATQTSVLAVHPSLPVKSMQELIAYAKTRPGALHYGTAGIGHPAHIMLETLKLKTGIDIQHVPYKGIIEAYLDLIAGRVQIMLAPYGSMRPYFDKLRLLAVSSATRFPPTPDLPTIAEALSLPDFVLRDWYAVVAPGAMSEDVARRINGAMNDFFKSPAFAEFVKVRGLTVMLTSPEETQKYLMEELDRWAELAKRARVEVD